MATYVELFQSIDRNHDGSPRWRWRARSSNHRVIDTPGQSFYDKSTAIRSARRVHGADVLLKTLPR